MSDYILVNGTLYHHGIKGQKWGERNYQNEDGSYTAKGQAENNGHGRYSSVDDNKNKSNTVSQDISDEELKNTYGMVKQQEREKFKKAAKILGISLATTAGVLAVAYAYKKLDKQNLLFKSDLDISYEQALLNDGYIRTGKDYVERHMSDVNHRMLENYARLIDSDNRVINDQTLFLSEINEFNIGNPVGELAERNGFGLLKNGKDLLNNAVEVEDFDKLYKSCIVDQRYSTSGFDRRLSCWSGSHAFLTSMLTGKECCSKNYQNLVEFNDFGKLYNNKQKIVDLFGNTAHDFVGKSNTLDYGKLKREDAYSLVKTIFNNFTKPNAVDGSSVGMIDAAYRTMGCTHQWNFKINSDGALYMIDTWSAKSYKVATKAGSTIKYSMSGMNTLIKELTDEVHADYNRDSFRIYSPQLEDLNLDMISKFILAKKK